MVRLSRVELVLRVLTALYLIIAAVALLAPTRPPDDVVEPAGLAAAPAVAAPNPSSAANAGDIVAANIFSLTRQPPARRYDPLTFDTEPSVPAPPPVYTQPATSDDEAVPKLFGIVGGPNAAALLRLDAASPGALLYRVGERGGAYRVEEINEQSVVLSGPAGRIVLRLARQES